MTFDARREMARAARQRAAGLGFDSWSITAQDKRLIGIRLAQGVVCRENVDRHESAFLLAGAWAGRAAQREVQADGPDALVAHLGALRRDLERQPEDQEHVPAPAATGELRWELPARPFAETFAPEVVYPLIEAQVAPVRGTGLRVTGYIEAQELHAHVAGAGPGGLLDLTTRDHGATVSLTVDDERTGAVGATQGATLAVRGGGDLAAVLAEALAEAVATCRAGAAARELAPGDYTVVLHPAAVQDLLQTTLLYGLFDRRKVDERRTYLSGKLAELGFPEGLELQQSLALPLPGGGLYADLPLNHRHVPCRGLELVGNGRIQDLHVSAYWGRRLGIPETFGPHAAPPVRLAARPGTPLHGRHQDLAALIASTERGVYVANLWYLRMVAEMEGTLTGMTRDGLFAIEDGRVAGPLRHMRWHDNPFRILGAVSGLTDAARLFGRPRLAGPGRTPLSAAPALRVEGFHFSSVTRF